MSSETIWKIMIHELNDYGENVYSDIGFFNNGEIARDKVGELIRDIEDTESGSPYGHADVVYVYRYRANEFDCGRLVRIYTLGEDGKFKCKMNNSNRHF